MYIYYTYSLSNLKQKTVVFRLNSTPLASSDMNVITVSYDGTVQLTLKYNANLVCSMVADDFPFDTQYCPIIVGLWTYNYSEVVLHLMFPVNGLAPYNGDWNFAPVMGVSRIGVLGEGGGSLPSPKSIRSGQSYPEGGPLRLWVLGLRPPSQLRTPSTPMVSSTHIFIVRGGHSESWVHFTACAQLRERVRLPAHHLRSQFN
jgi:hypothetical protein